VAFATVRSTGRAGSGAGSARGGAGSGSRLLVAVVVVVVAIGRRASSRGRAGSVGVVEIGFDSTTGSPRSAGASTSATLRAPPRRRVPACPQRTTPTIRTRAPPSARTIAATNATLRTPVTLALVDDCRAKTGRHRRIRFAREGHAVVTRVRHN